MWCYTVEKTGKELLNLTIQRPVSCVNRGGKAEWFSRSGLVFAAWKEEKSRMENKENAARNDLSYEEIMDKLKESYPFERLMSRYRCAMMEVSTKFQVLNEELSLQYDRNPIETVKTRLKSLESIVEKLQRKHLPLTLEAVEQEINDVAGVRVICSYPSDIITLSEAFLKQDDIQLITRKDYILTPKPNGYRSLHLIISIPIFLHDQKRHMHVEVQFRTISMDWWASLEHKIRYKKDLPLPDALEKELLECANISEELDQRMENLQIIADSMAKNTG